MTRATVQPHPAKQSLGGRRALIGLILIAAISLLWWHGARHCDVLALFGPGGKASGLVSFEGRIWLVTSNIDIDEPWSARTLSASSDEGLALRQLLVEGNTFAAPWTPDVTSRGPFFLASYHKDAFGLPGKWCTTAGGPIWVLVPLAVWPLATWAFRRLRLRRRRRRGWCVACGYDLQGATTSLCPECGCLSHESEVARTRTD